MRRAAKAAAATVLGLVALAPAVAEANSSQTVFFEAPRDLSAGPTTVESRARRSRRSRRSVPGRCG